MVEVRGLLAYAVSVCEAPRSVLEQIYELAGSRDVPAEATGEDGGPYHRLPRVHRLHEPGADRDAARPAHRSGRKPGQGGRVSASAAEDYNVQGAAGARRASPISRS